MNKLAIAIFLLALAAVGPSAQADIIASNPGPRTTESPVGRVVITQETHGQTFTAALSLQLTTIEIEMRRVYSTPTTPNFVIVSLYDTSGGYPTGSPLATQSMPFGSLDYTVGIKYVFDFTADNLHLTAGTEYAFNVGTDINGGSDSLNPMAVADAGSDTYAGGHVLHNVGGGYVTWGDDAIFTVNGVIPEPSSAALLALGAFFIIARRSAFSVRR